MVTERAVAYLWVSPQRQQRSGLGLDAQRAAIERFAATESLTIAAEFVEEVVEVQKDGGIAILSVVRHVLIECFQSGSRKMVRCQVSHRSKEVRRKIAQLHDLAGVIAETEHDAEAALKALRKGATWSNGESLPDQDDLAAFLKAQP